MRSILISILVAASVGCDIPSDDFNAELGEEAIVSILREQGGALSEDLVYAIPEGATVIGVVGITADTVGDVERPLSWLVVAGQLETSCPADCYEVDITIVW